MKNFKRVTLALLTCSLSQFAFAVGSGETANSCEEILKALTTISFDSVFEDVERHSLLGELSTIYGQRSADAQSEIDKKLTENHLRREMSFQVRNPETGFYDKFVAVPVNGHIAPIRKVDFDRMVRSTGPVLRALRTLLQKAYSQKEMTVESLGLGELPPDEAAIVLNVLRDSIYREPALVAPQMAEYPFLAVSGFDGAIVDPKKPQNVFFEMNLGTPSGMANNADLLDDLAQVDGEVARTVAPYLTKDKTFALLRETIEGNAKAWTGLRGLSVVISPGIYNGAHPDVAAIARRAGLPLVKSSDLYEDASGNIRLNLGLGQMHPIVSGIYNRMEDSFFLQSSVEEIPLISPQYADVSDLSAKTGLKLRPGAIYRWVYGDDGKIVDIERDAEGRPLLQEVWDTIGLDPSRPDAPRGSFARAILNRKLYVSNVGGRLVDDKRLFRIVSTHLAQAVRGTKVAGPVASLSPNNLSALFRDPNSFVVKAPANSGGVGIHFLRTMNETDKAALLNQVRLHPGDYEVQYVSPIATLPQAHGGSFANVAIDLRIFVMMDENGEVDAGPNSLLLRTAPPGGLYSNTSRGGGYGIGVVVADKQLWFPRERRPLRSSLTAAQSDWEATRVALEDLKSFWIELTATEKEDEIPEEMIRALRERATSLSFQFRGLLHFLETPLSALPSWLRDFSQDPNVAADEISQMLQHLDFAFHAMRDSSFIIEYNMRSLKRADPVWWDRINRRLEDPTGLIYSPLNSRITYRKLAEPVVAYYWEKGSERGEKYEMAEIVKVDEPVIQQMIDFVRENGGEVRLMKRRMLYGESRTFVGWRYESPYFWVNLDPNSQSYLKPVIGIDLTGDRAIAALSHEMEHFKIWLESYKMKLASGLDHEAAVKAAVDHVWERDMIVYGERRAVAAEMQAERDYPTSIFNQSRGMSRPLNFWEEGYLNRITYPEFEAVRQVLYQHVNQKQDLDVETLRKYMTAMVQKSLELRTEALRYLEANPNRRLEEYWENHSISDLLTHPYGIERLREHQTEGLFNRYLDEVCRELTGGIARCS